jgi:multiple sugar transport system permease protein
VTKTAEPAREATRRAAGPGAWFLVLPALIPILVLSVGPLLYGVLLAFTDAQSGRTEPTEWIGTLNFRDLLHDTLFWESFRIGPLAAAAFLATLPSLVVFAVIQRRITGGVLAGAVKS